MLPEANGAPLSPWMSRGRHVNGAKSHELIDGESGIGDDPSERALSDYLVVRHDNTTVRHVAAKDHMAPFLAAEHESDAFQGGTDLRPDRSAGSWATPAATTS